jgi:hypothetical protein
LKEDVRNNSAWNHRYFILFGRLGNEKPADEIVKKEIDFTEEAIRLAPQNQSPWNYIKACVCCCISLYRGIFFLSLMRNDRTDITHLSWFQHLT